MKKNRILFNITKDADLQICLEAQNMGHTIKAVCYRHKHFLVGKDLGINDIVSFPKFWKENRQIRKFNLQKLIKEYDLLNPSKLFYLDTRFREKVYSLNNDEMFYFITIKFYLSLNLDDFDSCVGELSRSYYITLYRLCNFFDIHYLQLSNFFLIKGIIFFDGKFKVVGLDERWNLLSKSKKNKTLVDSKKIINNFLKKQTYLHQNINKKTQTYSELLNSFYRKINFLNNEIKSLPFDFNYSADRKYSFFFFRFFRNNRVLSIKTWFNKVRWSFISQKALPNCKFFYFPLHVQPETTSDLFAENVIDNYSQQATLIERLARNLPPSTKLLVKDHPFMIDKRSPVIYKKLVNNPRICFVSPLFNQFDILKNCTGVVTCVGSVAIEARLLDIPVGTLSNSYYSEYINVFQIKTSDDMNEFFSSALHKTRIKFTKDEEIFMAKVINSIYKDGSYGTIDHMADQDFSLISEIIISEINFRKFMSK